MNSPLHKLKSSPKTRTTTLHKALLAAGLLSGAALSSLGFAAPANAAPACSGAYSPAGLIAMGSTGCTIGDKLYSDFSFTNMSTGFWGFTQFGTTYNLSASSLNFTDKVNPFSYSYKVAITGITPGQAFASYNTDATVNDVGSGKAYSKTLQTITPGLVTGPSTATQAAPGLTIPLVTLGPVYFTSTVALTQGQISTVSDVLDQKFQPSDGVPGPLPLLGAGAAFGLSRRIRSRIKASA
jgi:MYXO-CTERM domain-containing protein